MGGGVIFFTCLQTYECCVYFFYFIGSEGERSRVEEILCKILLCCTVGFNRGFKVHLVFVSKPT